MALTLSELIVEVKALCGRTGDTVLVTDTRVTRWLNEAQDAIVRACTGHLDLETRGELLSSITLAETVSATTWNSGGTIMTGTLSTWKTDGNTLVTVGDKVKVISGTNATAGWYTVSAVTDDTHITLSSSIGSSPSSVTYEIYRLACLRDGVYQYDLANATPTIYHVFDAAYVDGLQSQELDYLDTDEFDEEYPDPIAGSITGIPEKYTRRGNTLEFYPSPGSSEEGKKIKLNYTKKPTTFVSTDTSATCDMLECDNGLIWYALAEAWTVIGQNDTEVVKYKTLFKNWLEEEYRPYKDGLYGSTADDIVAGGA